jgi:hypothetical protein
MMPNRPSHNRAHRERLVAGSALLVGLALCAVLGLPAGLRLVPPRYLSRLPEPLQRLAARPHPDLVPTPAVTPVPLRLTVTVAAVAGGPSATPRAPGGQASATARPPATDTAEPSATPRAATPEPTAIVPAGSQPSATFTPPYIPSNTQAARSTPADLSQSTVLLTGFRHTYQTWNNCGPATLVMHLSYLDWGGSQAQAASVLKPSPEDQNVSPWQMAEYARSQGFGVRVRTGGTLDDIKALLAAGFPVLVEKGFDPEPDRLGWMGHYELIIGYSDPLQQVVAMDSYLGPDQAIPYSELLHFWQHFNYTYLLVYEPGQEAAIEALLGPEGAAVHQAALARAQSEIDADPGDAFAWFNLGTNLTALGDNASASAAYDQARVAGLPWRMLWYQFGPYEAYNATGRYDDTIALADSVLAVTANIEESYYYKGQALQARGDTGGARALYETALRYNPNFTPASAALASLP